MYTPMLPKTVTVHRYTIRKDLTEIFTDASVLNSYLDVVVIDARGEPEKGKGKGIVLDSITINIQYPERFRKTANSPHMCTFNRDTFHLRILFGSCRRIPGYYQGVSVVVI